MDRRLSLRFVVVAGGLTAALLTACGTSPAARETAVPRAPLPTIVSLTFDDGNADNFAAAGILDQYKLHGTFYVPSNLIDTDGHMTWEQLGQLREHGHEIGGHTLDHVDVRKLTSAQLPEQICGDRKNLQARGYQVVSFAYPFGGYNEAAKTTARDCGYSSARSVSGGPDLLPPADLFALRALPYVVNDTDFAKLQRYVSGTRKDGGGWAIFIFHHVCEGCDYYSVTPDLLKHFAEWLAGQQSAGNLTVKTVGEVVLSSAAGTAP